MKTIIPCVMLCALALAACSDKPPPAQSTPAAASTTAQANNAPWSGMQQDEQRAKDAAKAVNQAQDNEQRQAQQSQ